MYTKINFFFLNTNRTKKQLSVLPLCTIAIKPGHAGILDLSVYLINTSLQKHVFKKTHINKHHQEYTGGGGPRRLLQAQADFLRLIDYQ